MRKAKKHSLTAVGLYELIENEKERAEHVMLVDLERNDLGRVCKYGSVQVDEFMVIEKYSHVMHIVSNVRGELDDGKDGFDLIDAVFPGGTITGAPKIRTMEIIEELEPVRRGPYTGSFGWIKGNGDLELNIIIRTMLVNARSNVLDIIFVSISVKFSTLLTLVPFPPIIRSINAYAMFGLTSIRILPSKGGTSNTFNMVILGIERINSS